MEDRLPVVFDEIQQLIEQYKREVPSGRTAWPQSIKDRVFELKASGISLPKIAARTGIAYHTLIKWHQHRKGESFKELAVVPSGQKQLATVTVTKKRKYTKSSQLLTVTVGNQIRIEGLDVAGAIKIISRFGRGGDTI